MSSDIAEEELVERWYVHKSQLMETSLGKEHDIVMHALIPYAVGGALDLYYYPEGVPGTAIATKELTDLPSEGASNRVYRSFELVMFTKHPLDLNGAKGPNAPPALPSKKMRKLLKLMEKYSPEPKLNLVGAPDETTPFGQAHRNISRILNLIARYSAQAELNPNETCEFPKEMNGVGGKCLIFDGYASHSDDGVENFGLLAVIEVFRSEMEYAQKQGGGKLIEQLKAEGYYPYSDLDREPVV